MFSAPYLKTYSRASYSISAIDRCAELTKVVLYRDTVFGSAVPEDLPCKDGGITNHRGQITNCTVMGN